MPLLIFTCLMVNTLYRKLGEKFNDRFNFLPAWDTFRFPNFFFGRFHNEWCYQTWIRCPYEAKKISGCWIESEETKHGDLIECWIIVLFHWMLHNYLWSMMECLNCFFSIVMHVLFKIYANGNYPCFDSRRNSCTQGCHACRSVFLVFLIIPIFPLFRNHK